MTEKLYYKDTSILSNETTVASLEATDGKYAISLKESIIFPGGGGEAPDRAFINGLPVLSAYEKGGCPIYLIESPIEVGSAALCTVDGDERRRRAQAHSGEHLLSGIAHNLFGAENVGFHKSGSAVVLDLDKKLSTEDIKRLEALAEEAIFKNLDIYSFFPADDEASSLSYRAKHEIEGTLRLVAIDGIDVCACCALHVDKTGEIGIVKILEAIPHRGGTRITALFGREAHEHYTSVYENALSASAMLSANPSTLPSAIALLKSENAELKRLLAESRRTLADEWIKALDFEDSFTAFIAPYELDNDISTYIVSKGSELTKVFVLLIPTENGCRYVIFKEGGILPDQTKTIHSVLSGKGGGRGDIIRGVFERGADETLSYLKEYFNR